MKRGYAVALMICLGSPRSVIAGGCIAAPGQVDQLIMRLPWQTGQSHVASFGYCAGHHSGYQVDFDLQHGTPVVAVATGVVIQVGDNASQCWPTSCGDPVLDGGIFVKIQHTSSSGVRYNSAYLHLSQRLKNCGDQVAQGELIGYSGNSGFASGPHLHFHIRRASPSSCPTPVEVENVRPVPMVGLVRSSQSTTITDFVAGETYTAIDPPSCTSHWETNIGQPGLNATPRVMMVYNGELIVGGDFTLAGGQSANRIARWNGSTWSQLGSGMDGPVYAMTIYNGKLIAGGDFTTAGGATANRIAQWDGSGWQALGSGWSSPVRALTVYGIELIAGGGTGAGFVQSWNGLSWQTVGLNLPGTAFALTVHDGEIVVAAGGVYRWTGTVWTGLGGSPFNNPVLALGLYEGQLIAAGIFTNPAERIARWDGLTWSALGNGLNSAVNVLSVYNGELIAGGQFTTADDQPANRVARWNGSSSIWSPLAGGANNTVNALVTYNNDLIVGGDFVAVNQQPSTRIARWLACPPPIQPCPYDGNGDQVVDVVDLLGLINAWGACP